jgi:hypothetical protein
VLNPLPADQLDIRCHLWNDFVSQANAVPAYLPARIPVLDDDVAVFVNPDYIARLRLRRYRLPRLRPDFEAAVGRVLAEESNRSDPNRKKNHCVLCS